MTRRILRPESRLAAAAIAVGVLVAACGSTSDSDAGDSGEVHTIEHELGEADVPVEPDKVVALDPYYSLPTALSAGANVVGASHQPFGESFPPYVDAEAAADVTDVGWFTELNVERIATLNPDVIIGLVSFVEPYYDRLSKIAPTVALSLDSMVWKDSLRTIGQAIGEADAVEASLEGYEKRAAKLAGQLKQTGVADNPVSLLNIRALDDLRVYTKSCAAAILGDLGITMHLVDQTEDGESSVNLSIERLTDADAANLLYFAGSVGTNPEDARSAYEQVADHPLWNEMEAVQSGNANPVNAEWWFNCGSVPAADRILDDVSSLFLMR